MLLDVPLQELLADVNSLVLESSETLDEGVVLTHRNIYLAGDQEYVFSPIKDAGNYGEWCVDGGNAQVISYGGLVVELNKVAAIEHDGGSGARSHGPHKFLSLTYNVGDEIHTKLYHDERALVFLPKKLEPKHIRGQSETYILSGRARRVAEQLFAAHIVGTRSPQLVVLDGTLGHTNDRAEISALDSLFKVAKNSGTILCALTKSSTLMRGAEPLTHHVWAMARQRGLKHFYAWVGRARRGDAAVETQLYVVRLSSLAKKAYLLEVYNAETEEEVSRLMYTLASDANNVTVPGYPYGLALADMNARVHGVEEAGMVRLVLGKHTEIPIIGEAYAHQQLDFLV